MKRRDALAGMLSLGVGAPHCLHAQPSGRTHRVGLFLAGSADAVARQRGLIVERLATHEFVEGRNLMVDVRQGAFNRASDVESARRLIESRPDAILVDTTPLALRIREASTAIPIVFFGVADPAGIGS